MPWHKSWQVFNQKHILIIYATIAPLGFNRRKCLNYILFFCFFFFHFLKCNQIKVSLVPMIFQRREILNRFFVTLLLFEIDRVFQTKKKHFSNSSQWTLILRFHIVFFFFIFYLGSSLIIFVNRIWVKPYRKVFSKETSERMKKKERKMKYTTSSTKINNIDAPVSRWNWWPHCYCYFAIAFIFYFCCCCCCCTTRCIAIFFYKLIILEIVYFVVGVCAIHGKNYIKFAFFVVSVHGIIWFAPWMEFYSFKQKQKKNYFNS